MPKFLLIHGKYTTHCGNDRYTNFQDSVVELKSQERDKAMDEAKSIVSELYEKWRNKGAGYMRDPAQGPFKVIELVGEVKVEIETRQERVKVTAAVS